MSKMQVSRHPDRKEMWEVFALCQNDDWGSLLERVKKNPLVGTATMTMANNIQTTVCHKALTSKAGIKLRAEVILHVLKHTPQAAKIPNGYGSLCLHVACQRNLKSDAKTKEKLILALIQAFPGALLERGGAGRRTPLHIIFTGTSSITASFVLHQVRNSRETEVLVF